MMGHIEYAKDIGVIVVTILGVGMVFRFMISQFKDAFTDHLKRIQEAWVVEGTRIHEAMNKIHADLERHYHQEEDKLDRVYEEVSEIRQGLMAHIADIELHKGGL